MKENGHRMYSFVITWEIFSSMHIIESGAPCCELTNWYIESWSSLFTSFLDKTISKSLCKKEPAALPLEKVKLISSSSSASSARRRPGPGATPAAIMPIREVLKVESSTFLRHHPLLVNHTTWIDNSARYFWDRVQFLHLVPPFRCNRYRRYSPCHHRETMDHKVYSDSSWTYRPR